MATKPAAGTPLNGANPLADSTLKAFWAFLEGTGTSSVDSAGSRTINFNIGGWATDAAGPIYRIPTANMGPASISTPLVIGHPNSWSMVFGAKLTNNDIQGQVIGDNTTVSGFVWLAGGSYFGIRDDNGNDFNFSSQNVFNAYHNWGISVDYTGSGTMHVYKDGVEFLDSPIGLGGLHTTWTFNTIGNGYSSFTNFAFIGDISYIGVYSGRVLSTAEFNAYNSNPYGIFVGAATIPEIVQPFIID